MTVLEGVGTLASSLSVPRMRLSAVGVSRKFFGVYVGGTFASWRGLVMESGYGISEARERDWLGCEAEMQGLSRDSALRSWEERCGLEL